MIFEAMPCEMKNPFTGEEVMQAVNKLKIGKSSGIDQICAEYLLYAPQEVYNGIAEIYNMTAAHGDPPIELITGILIPLQKPGKKAGPCTNIRPIILLSLLRKILAIILLNRTGQRIEQHIPQSQAAYQKNRSTTEHVATYKLLAEKALSSSDYELTIILMDLSKAFDTIHRATLLQDLSRIVEKDELHMLKILLTNIQYKVRCGKTLW